MVRRVWRIAVVLALLVGCGSDDEATTSSGDEDAGEAGLTKDGSTTPPSDASGPKPDAGVDAAVGPEESGEATYYDANGTGACGFPASTNLDVAAMNKSQYKKADCGKCVSVTGPKGVVVVRIVDLCPGCASGDLDLSKTSFAKIANLSAGRVPITWHFVACP